MENNCIVAAYTSLFSGDDAECELFLHRWWMPIGLAASVVLGVFIVHRLNYPG